MIRRTPQFLSSLIEQSLHLELHAGEEVSERFLDSAEATIEFLEHRPLVGRAGGFHNPQLSDLRRWRVKGFPNHLVMYLPQPDGVLLVMLVHASQDLETLLGDLPNE